MPPKAKSMLCLSTLDPAAYAVIDQNSNTSNHMLFENIQMAMFTWFDPKTGPEARERSAKILADDQQKQNASTIGFLFKVFPMDPAPPDVFNEKLIDQFYLLGPVGERFFHWMFLLGAADNVIEWKNAGKSSVASLKKIEKPKQKTQETQTGVDGKASENAAVEVQTVEDVPFWRALEEVRQTLIKHLETKKLDANAKSGLYFASENAAVEVKVKAALNIPGGSASEIFTIPEIYQRAKDLKDFTNDETCIRGQLEFEWLITRPYSRRWANQSKPPNQEPPNQDKIDEEQSSEVTGDLKQTDSESTCSCFSSCLQKACSCFSSSPSEDSASKNVDIRELTKNRKMSTVEIELHIPMNGGAAASSPRSKRSHSSVLNSTSIRDEDLKTNLNNNDWEWNESVWESVVSAVGNKSEPNLVFCHSVFRQRTADFVDEYTGENLFHLFIADVHNNDDSEGTRAALNIRTLLKYVKHPAYRLELLASRVTGRFFCPVNGEVKLGQTPLHFAVSLGKWEAVVALLEDACCLLDELYSYPRQEELGDKPDKPKTGSDKPDKPKTEYLRDHTAPDSKRIQLAVKEQLKRQYSVLWAKDSQGNSVFHLAVIHNRRDMYEKLYNFSESLSKLLDSLYFGMDIGDKEKEAQLRNKRVVVGSKFNSFEAYDNSFLKNDNNFTPLELAAYLGNVEMMQFLLTKFETRRKWGYASNSVELKRVNIQDLDTYKTLVHERTFSETWIDLIAPEDLEPNLLSIVVTRNKLPFLEGSKFPEFSAVLQQKWDIFGKRLMTFWFVAVMCVFVLFQVYVISVVNEVKGVPYASSTQQKLAYALYAVAATFLVLDWIFEYTLGTVRSETELDSIGATHRIGSREYPINVLDIDMPPWKIASKLATIAENLTPQPIHLAACSPPDKDEIKQGLNNLSLFISNRHVYSARADVTSDTSAEKPTTNTTTTCPSLDNLKSCFHQRDDDYVLPRGWAFEETKLFRQFVGFNYCTRSSLSFCSKINQLQKKYFGDQDLSDDLALDIVLDNRKMSDDSELEHEKNFIKTLDFALTVLHKFVKILKRLTSCFLGIHDPRGLYSHMWCICMLLSGLAHHYESFDLRVTFISAAAVFMFLYVLRFYLLIETLGVYMVMILRMLTNDLTKWMAVTVMYLIAFAEAFVLMGMVLSPDEPASAFFLTQFKWVLGDSTTDGFGDDEKAQAYPVIHQFAVILFCIFMVLIPITLINMLTGMFSKTCDDYAAQAVAIHRYNRATITLSLERVLYRLPLTVLWLLGFRSSLSAVDNNSVLRAISAKLTGKEAPNPSKYIFRYHRTAYRNFFRFWPTRYTFVNCRTGYPLEAAQSVFHKQVPLKWFEAPLSFLFHGLDPNLKSTLRMNPARSFYFFGKSLGEDLKNLRNPENSGKLEKSRKKLMTSLENNQKDSEVDNYFKQYIADLQKELSRHFEKKLINRVSKKIQAEVANIRSQVAFAPDDTLTKEQAEGQALAKKQALVDLAKCIHQHLCSFMEAEFVSNENYHLLMKDFPEKTE